MYKINSFCNISNFLSKRKQNNYLLFYKFVTVFGKNFVKVAIVTTIITKVVKFAPFCYNFRNITYFATSVRGS